MIDWDQIQKDFNSLIQKFPELEALLFSDQSDGPYGISMNSAALLMLILQAHKEAQYGASWAKNGEIGVMLNYKRKEDRMDQLCALCVCGDDVEHQIALIDTLVDRALYGMMWLCYIAKNRPQAFELWLERMWCPTTGIEFSKIVELIGLEE